MKPPPTLQTTYRDIGLLSSTADVLWVMRT
jgi:hypothetical protein